MCHSAPTFVPPPFISRLSFRGRCNTVFTPRRRPQLHTVVLAARGPPPPSVPPPPLNSSQVAPPPAGDESYLQCPQCSAVYQLDSDELEGPSRVVACSACLHEWYASEDTLLWGDELALQALASSSTSSFPSVQSRDNAPSAPVTAAADNASSARNTGNDGNDLFTSSKQETPSQHRRRDNDVNSFADIPTRGPGRKQVMNENLDDGDGYKDENYMKGREDDKSNWRNRGSRVDALPKENELPSQTDGKAPKYSSRDGSDRAEQEAVKSLSEGESRREFVGDDLKSEKPVFSIFVGNLSFRATEEDLYRAFSGYGLVVRCQVPCDSGGASKGYGFVEMRTRESGLRAIESLQGASILGRDISLTEARHRTFTPRKAYRSNADSPGGRRRRNVGDRREQGKRYRDDQNTTDQYDSRR